MPSTESVDQYYATLLSKCIKSKSLKLGRTLHSHFIKTALNLNTFLANRAIDMYAKCDSIDSAQAVFDELPHRNTHSWNTIISAHSRIGRFEHAHLLLDEMPEPNVVSYNSVISSLNRHGYYRQSIYMFRRMQEVILLGGEKLVMDEVTVVGVVNACARLRAGYWLRQMHVAALVAGLQLNGVVCNSMIDAYGECSEPEISYLIFSRMNERDVVSWTSMVVAYARASRMVDAQGIFDQMPVRNAVSWTALIAGFMQNGRGDRALNVFSEMQEARIRPNDFTYVCALGACADLALVEKGKQLHGHILRRGSGFNNVYVVNALVDVYCKCGDTTSALTLFENSTEKDIVTWNSMITGFAQNGQGKVSLALFNRMLESGVVPNHVTFLGVLAACSHSGLETEGLRVLHRMEKDFGVQPQLDHYSILIDLLGRKNRLREAMELLEKSPDGCSDHVGMWGALFSACRVHGNMELAKRAAKRLLLLEPENTGRYVMLANVYAEAGRWEDAGLVRRRMDEKGLQKEVAYSWIEVRDTRHEFVARDKSHAHMEDITDLLTGLTDQMKDVGYVPHVDHSFLP
ncbi:unnamed protein product [Cuscuta campestris]|uniref:DYW domain-containing protein n=1 Tax=Cuscuta campestris TaxID=132261 RepID=A0A484L7Q4_9ASTE|nr:unnamed protein product [Cuscuta campestris]